ncbi:hypothetical protein [Streptomyces tritici]|uniref:hypothetical protein n=1 Tax=Streptomyces tritici TaxID=2054410 RepID=UPI003AEF7D24
MIDDRTPQAAPQYVVLVEEVVPTGDDQHWQLVKSIPMEGDRAAADTRARELAMEHVPRGVYLPAGATAGRSVCRFPDGSWLIEVGGSRTYNYSPRLARISTAELVHVQEYVPPPVDDRPAAAAPRRRLFGRD